MGRTIATKARIKAEFLKLYMKKPIEDIRVMDICEACNISRGTFYYHFADVPQVCEEIEDDIIRDEENAPAIKKMPLLVSQYKAAELDEFVDTFVDMLEEHRKRKDTIHILLDGSCGQRYIKKWTNSVMDTSAEFLKKSNLSPENQNWTGTFIASGLVSMLVRWVRNDCHDDPKLIAQTYANVLFKGSVSREK